MRHSTAASKSFLCVAALRSACVRRPVVAMANGPAVVTTGLCHIAHHIDKQQCWFYVRPRGRWFAPTSRSSRSEVPPVSPTQAQHERAARFRDLHAAGRPLQLVNAWDATSARVLAAAGAPAIGTTSFGVALDHGVWDAELLPFDEVLAVTSAITSAVDVPVSVDLEAGRGDTPDDVQRAVEAVIARGA